MNTILCFFWQNSLSVSQICYFFYKNITFGFTLFFYEMYTSFSGQAAYNDWFMSFYNVFFTSLPVIALGVFDQDVSSKLCLKVKPQQTHYLGVVKTNLNHGSLLTKISIHVSVSITLPRRCTKPTIQLEKNIRLGIKRSCKFRDHILLLHPRVGASILSQRRRSCWLRNTRNHIVHMCRMGCELPNGIINNLLHIHSTYFHMGKHFHVVHFPHGIWSYEPFNINNCL